MILLQGVFMMVCAVAMQDAEPQYANIGIVKDFTEEFSAGELINCDHHSASFRETCGGVNKPGIFLHPSNAGESQLKFSAVQIPEGASPTFLLFCTGLRDGIPWDEPVKPNGVRFSVYVEGEKCFTEDVVASSWNPHALDLTSLAGKTVNIIFATDAIDGRSNYDWAVLGEPLLVRYVPVVDTLTEKCAGVALAKMGLSAPDTVTLKMGESTRSFELPAGQHWLPLEFNRLLRLECSSANDVSAMKTLWVGAHEFALKREAYSLSSPLVLAGEPFSVMLKIKNVGRGYFPAGAMAELAVMGDEPETKVLSLPDAQSLDVLAPGASATLLWRDVIIGKGGHYSCRVALPDWVWHGEQKTDELQLHLFPPIPAEFTGKVEVKPDGTRFTGIIGQRSGQMRLKVVEDNDRESYLIAETMVNGEFRRAGSLYPLAEGIVASANAGEPKQDRLHIQEGNIFPDYAEARGTIGNQPVNITFTPDPEKGRIRICCSLTAVENLSLYCFRGPTVLAGDRNYGASKDFAVFGGLEYLEKEEESSSERDLAYPLNLRSVPAPHKVGAPVMAVQGRDTLLGVVWDPHQTWASGERMPASWFDAPKPGAGLDYVRMSLFLPSVGEYVTENTVVARKPYSMRAGDKVGLEYWLVLDSTDAPAFKAKSFNGHKGGLLFQAYKHYFDLFGMPKPTVQPRTWEEEKRLCIKGYDSVWTEDPPGWAHCAGWNAGLHVGQAVPQLLLMERPEDFQQQSNATERIRRVIDLAIKEQGPHFLWSHGGSHIMFGELPYYEGCVAASMRDAVNSTKGALNKREDGLWRWRPANEKIATLGKAGDHTLAQAALPLYRMLRTARLAGDRDLSKSALDLMGVMGQYEVPRGAQTWECPLYQPDILAAAQAIRACTEAYRLSGDSKYLDEARYWAWTGIPFLYLWDMDGYPTMRYNTISVMGSTFYTHSWIGLPVVWCGLVYAYALQDFAEFDPSFDWKTVAQGITNSAMWQQYAEGTSAGCYPDSWDMVKNKPNPADISPENILVNELRLRGMSPEIRFVSISTPDGPVMVNSAADISAASMEWGGNAIQLLLRNPRDISAYVSIAPVGSPFRIEGSGDRQSDDLALRGSSAGWQYAEDIRMLVLKPEFKDGLATVKVGW